MISDIWDYLGETAQESIQADNIQSIIDYFLAHPEDLNRTDTKSNTPLHLAYLWTEEDESRFTLCRWFLEQGVSVSIRNHIGRDMLYYMTRHPDHFSFHCFDTFEKTLNEAKQGDKAYLRYLLVRCTSSYPENFRDIEHVHRVLEEHDMLFLITTLLTDFKLNSIGLKKRIHAYLSYPEYQSSDINGLFLDSLGAVRLAHLFSQQFDEHEEICEIFTQLLELPFKQGKEHYLFVEAFAKTLNEGQLDVPKKLVLALLKSIDFEHESYLSLVTQCPVLHQGYLDLKLNSKTTHTRGRKI